MRWSEEVLLLQEEMRRVLAYHKWHACWWEWQATRWTGLTSEGTEGLFAYAYRQAGVFRAMHDHCQFTWRYLPEFSATGYGTDSAVLGLNPVTASDD